MNLEVRWQESMGTSCLHSAQILAEQGPEPLSDNLTNALKPAVDRLLSELQATGIPLKSFWYHALPLSAQLQSNRDLAGVVLRKTRGLEFDNPSMAESLGRVLTELSQAYLTAMPKAEQELPLRRRPLQEAWEARGPGLLYFLQRVLPEAFLPENVDVILVVPVSGGQGTAHLDYNSVRIEAMLYDPHPQLPEVARLGWLFSQLNLDLPKYSENIHRHRLPLVAQLATLPAILYAAEEVELVRPGMVPLTEAIKLWQITRDDPAPLAEVVQQWWNVQETRQAPWPVALAALDRMLG